MKSSSTLANQNGTVNSRNYFYPFGGNRGGAAFSALTTKRFTGQYHEQGLPGGEGLSYYGARWYDAQLGRFASADSIVPDPKNPQDLNRYAYVLNNPIKHIDPSGHECIPVEEGGGACDGGGGIETGGGGGFSSTGGFGGGGSSWFSWGSFWNWLGSFGSSGSSSIPSTSVSENAGSSWQQVNPYSAQRQLPIEQDLSPSDSTRHLSPYPVSSGPAILWDDPNPLRIRPSLPSGLDRTVLSGHGEYILGSGWTTMPEGTYFATYSKIGGGITDRLGNAIELDNVPSMAYQKVWGPGSKVPNYTLYPSHYGQPLTIMGNPVTVNGPTLLSDLLQPNMGEVHWAACTECVGARWTQQEWGPQGPSFNWLPK